MKLLLALVLAWSVTAQADILVYKNVLSETRTGGNKTQTFTATGWTVLDLDTLDTTTILVDALHKQFSVSYPTVTGYQVSPSKFSTNTLIQFTTDELEGASAKGINSKLTINADAVTKKPLYAQAPFSFLVSGNRPYTADDGLDYLHEFHGSLIFDGVTTLAANKSATDESDEVDKLTQSLTAKGYVQN